MTVSPYHISLSLILPITATLLTSLQTSNAFLHNSNNNNIHPSFFRNNVPFTGQRQQQKQTVRKLNHHLPHERRWKRQEQRRQAPLASALSLDDIILDDDFLRWEFETPTSSSLVSQQNVKIKSITTAGITHDEYQSVLTTISQTFDIDETSSIITNRLENPAIPKDLIGATGRVLLVSINYDDDHSEEEEDNWEGLLEEVRTTLSTALDSSVDPTTGPLKQPLLVVVRPHDDDDDLRQTMTSDDLAAFVAAEAATYELVAPVGDDDVVASSSSPVPTLCVEIDGAVVDGRWDTSRIVVFDDLIDDELRRRLLRVVLGTSSSSDEDVDIPRADRWIGGGLRDTPSDDPEEDDDDASRSCLGLTEEAIRDLCDEPHDALLAFESLLSRLFPHHVVCRLPSAVYGDTVTPLTANAPTARDVDDDGRSLYHYHIDGDPNTAPASPWTDVYGRYPNRSPDKPRFVSCLIYLNERWDGATDGAPTRFYDPGVGEGGEATFDVVARPGRVVFLDQDVSHTVVPPRASAGGKARYSLVWKLVLHPKRWGLEGDLWDDVRSEEWPDSILFGSAACNDER